MSSSADDSPHSSVNATAPASVSLQPAPEEPVPDEFDLLCEHCGYSLVGLTTQTRCPECGAEFDPNGLPLARVPWLYRKRLGRRAAYRKTVWAILLHPSDFAREVCRPVRISAKDAAMFRRATVRRAVASVGAIGMLIAAIGMYRSMATNLTIVQWIALVFTCGVEMAVLWAFFMVSTDLPTFIWAGLKERPHDLAPLHHYAAAPLALWPWVMVIVIAVAGYFELMSEPLWMVAPMWLILGPLGLAFLFLTWRIPQILMREAAHCSGWRVFALAIYLPIHWLMILIIALATGGWLAGLILNGVMGM